MQAVVGAGCWSGRAEGRVVWVAAGLRSRTETPPAVVPDRAAEVLRFRAVTAQALADTERWLERQPTVEGRLLVQGYRDALLEDAWAQRVCALVDGDGMPAQLAVMQAAEAVGAVFQRMPEMQERAAQVQVVSEWLAYRLADPLPLPADTILAAADLSPLEMLDLPCPALTTTGDPGVVGGGVLVWGVPHLGAHWHGRRVALDGPLVTLDVPDPHWWPFEDNRIKGHPVCYLNGDLEAIDRMAAKLGAPPAVMVHRLDDLAAVPLFVGRTALTALDLDRLGPGPRLKHPGVHLLLERAAQAARTAGVPLLAGGEPAERRPETWLALGFTGLYGRAIPRGGQHALRRNTEGGM